MASSTAAAVSVTETNAESLAVGAKRRKPIKTNKVPQIQVSDSVIDIIFNTCNKSELMPSEKGSEFSSHHQTNLEKSCLLFPPLSETASFLCKLNNALISEIHTCERTMSQQTAHHVVVL